jgi:ribose-phosphate pyrophosphokinase
MKLALLSGTANKPLAEAIGRRSGCELTPSVITRFPDGELHVEVLESVRGCDVFVVQPTSPPANDHLMELLLLADACRRAGAERMTAIMPYFAYARQDRRANGREAVGARVVGDQLRAAGFDRVIGLDMHTPAIEAILSVPLDHLTAVPMLTRAVQDVRLDAAVIVAPDLGATKLAERFSQAVGKEMAIVRKTRVSGARVKTSGLVGEVRGRRPVIVDDMISTGATIEAAANAVAQAGGSGDVIVVATHALLVADAVDRLRNIPVERMIVTDSVPVPTETQLPIKICGLDSLLADAIRRLHGGESLGALIRHE